MSDKKQFVTLHNHRFNVIESMNDSELEVSVKFFEWTSYQLHYVIDNKLVLIEEYTADTYGWEWEQSTYYSCEFIHIHPKYIIHIDSTIAWIKLMKYEN